MLRLRDVAIGVIVAVVLAAPMLEIADRWDQTLQDGNDTEINLMVVALCVGVAFAVAPGLLARVFAFASFRYHFNFTSTPESTLTPLAAVAAPIPNSRPPTLLRI